MKRQNNGLAKKTVFKPESDALAIIMPNRRDSAKYKDFVATIFDECWQSAEDAEEAGRRFVDEVFELGAYYAIAGVESCPSSGRIHLQAFVRLRERTRLQRFRAKWFNFHIERRKGSAFHASEYCKKDGRFIERGELPAPTTRDRRGQRREELAECLKRVIANDDVGSIIESHPLQYLQYGRRMREVAAEIRARDRSWKTNVVVFWGPTGSGKTRRALEEADYLCGGDVWISPSSNLQWFDGYCGNKGVLFDDYCPQELQDRGESHFRMLLRLLDRYPCSVPVKGAFVKWCPRIIWITSNTNPVEWFSGNHQLPPLMRRLDIIEKIE